MKKKFLGFLVIWLATGLGAKPYRGGELRTMESFLYGRFEVRCRFAPGSGVVSSFFTYHDNDPDWIGHWNEIDIEYLGRYDHQIQWNVITPGQVHHVATTTTDFNPSDSYHVYAIEWTPYYVAWFIDSAQVAVQVGSHVGELVYSQKLMMNIWQPADVNWAGTFNDSILPVYAFYDWVRYYTYDPDSGNAGSANQFRLAWEDPFDYFDIMRWQKATHTWDGNNCDFIPENVVFQDGQMILCLTDPVNTGYSGGPLKSEDSGLLLPDRLSPPYPNPFNRSLTIPVTGREGTVTIYNLLGKSVTALSTEAPLIRWDGTDRFGRPLESGIYLLRYGSRLSGPTVPVLLLK
ncbi:MAG: glycosyl hydrolase family protein [Candidatus Neomarinimicrobiota bacterium]|nr:MAG: glycosyl hydrolase family protein [Candidatus Neomarinimicrobiota bacterium]